MTGYIPSDENCLGIYCDGASLKAVKASQNRGKIVLGEWLETAILPEKEDVNPLYIDQELVRLRNLSRQVLSIGAIPGADCLLRRLKLKLTKQKDIDEAFLFQAEPLLPYPVEGAVLGKWTTEQREEGTTLAFASVKGEEVGRYLELYGKWGVDPEAITIEPLALAALAQFFGENKSLELIVDFGKKTILCALLKEGKLIASHTIAYGWNDLYEAQSQELSVQDFFSKPIQEGEKLTTILQLLEWNAIALLKETKTQGNPVLIVTGEGATILGIPEKIAEALQLELSSLKAPCSKENLNSFSIPIGIALSGLPSFKEKINLRQGDYAFKAPWMRYQRPLAITALLSLLLAFSLYVYSLSYTHYREGLLRERFLTLLSLTQKTYEDFEKNYEEKNKIEIEDGTVIPIHKLDTQAIEQRLDTLERQIRSTPDTFPLFPNTPRVSDLLAWISHHPSFVCPEKGPECPQANIESLSYTMVKRPEMSKKNEKYQVKVDLEFSTSSPMVAREFHDALIAPNDFVDPKGEIKWNATKGKYRTSFFLKDKTFYPGPLKGGPL